MEHMKCCEITFSYLKTQGTKKVPIYLFSHTQMDIIIIKTQALVQLFYVVDKDDIPEGLDIEIAATDIPMVTNP